MKYLLISFCSLIISLTFWQCCKETQPVLNQIGEWEVQTFIERYNQDRDSLIFRTDTTLYQLILNDDRTGLKIQDNKESKILDWGFEENLLGEMKLKVKFLSENLSEFDINYNVIENKICCQRWEYYLVFKETDSDGNSIFYPESRIHLLQRTN